MERFVIISGCSGGGKSTLLEELTRRSHAVVPEPGRRIVAKELGRGGSALPWTDGVAFTRQAVEMSLADRAAAEAISGWILFDRGLLDAAAGLHHLTGEMPLDLRRPDLRYNSQVFLAPSWQEIYRAAFVLSTLEEDRGAAGQTLATPVTDDALPWAGRQESPLSHPAARVHVQHRVMPRREHRR